MTAPDFLPVLSHGAHTSPQEGACVMEYVSILSGNHFTDKPACTHPVLAEMARNVNDRLPDSERQRLLPLIPRLIGTTPTGTENERKALSVRLAVWAARKVLHLVRPQDREVCETAIRTVELWLDGKATQQECQDAAHAAYAAANAAYAATGAAANAASAAASAAYAAANAAYAAAYAANAAYAAASAANAAYAAASAAYAATGAAANAADGAAANAADGAYDGLVEILTGLIDEYDRLTGRTETGKLSDQDIRLLTDATR